MGKKVKSHEEFKIQVNERFKNIHLESKYISSRHKIECHCNICGYRWSPIANNLIKRKSKGCPYCNGYVIKKTEQIEVILKEKNIKLLEKNFKKMKDMVECECLLDGYIWSVRLSSIVNSDSGCPKCANVPRLTIDDAKKEPKDWLHLWMMHIMGKLVSIYQLKVNG